MNFLTFTASKTWPLRSETWRPVRTMWGPRRTSVACAAKMNEKNAGLSHKTNTSCSCDNFCVTTTTATRTPMPPVQAPGRTEGMGQSVVGEVEFAGIHLTASLGLCRQREGEEKKGVFEMFEVPQQRLLRHADAAGFEIGVELADAAHYAGGFYGMVPFARCVDAVTNTQKCRSRCQPPLPWPAGPSRCQAGTR
jgi:hypothetical protein